MSKAVLVIDMPEHCDDCPFRVLWAKYHCVVNGRFCGDEQGFYSSLTKPSWCPLRPYEESIPVEWIKKKSLEFLMNRNFRWATDFQEVIDMWKVENNIPLFDGELKITMEKENE